MALDIPGINEKNFLDLYEGDCGIYLPVLRAYADEIPGMLNRLRNVSAENLRDYAIAMHGIKGSSASACAEEARNTAVKLEAMAKAGDIAGVLAQNAGFLKFMDNLASGIQKWFRDNKK